MAYYDDPPYICAPEAASRLGMTEHELLVFTLESGWPNHRSDTRGLFYDTADVEQIRQELKL
jgi:hypothetical protein